MITNFESLTYELADAEKQLIPRFVKALEKHIGRESAISATEIQAAYKSKNMNVSGARIRKIINYIRVHNLLPGLVSNSNGYFVAATQHEIDTCIMSLGQRAREIERVKAALELQRKALNQKGALK